MPLKQVDPFDPPGISWDRVSAGLAKLRRLLLLATTLVLVALVVAVLVLADPSSRLTWIAGTLLLALAVVGLAWPAIGRNVASWGYTERDDDLLIRHGVLLRRLLVVPYGRMQFVDVHTGPLQRAFGLATVQLHTAAAASDATIPGLSPAEAARLRDRLAALGEAQAAGL